MRRALGLALLAATLVGCSSNNGTCSTDAQCSSASLCCAGKCVDVTTSVAHCGACNNSCGAINGAASCRVGVCQLLCQSGFSDCNGQGKDGCETKTDSATENCGTCGHVCQSANAVSVCDRSLCAQASCNEGFGDCNASSSDGCETHLRTSLDHCGGCGKKCEVVNGTPACAAGSCTVAACKPTFGDCDDNAKTGCETDLTSDDLHCGVCPTACATGYHCKQSKCVAPELVFYGGLDDIQGTNPVDQVTSFNIDTHSWTPLTVGGADSPGPRAGHLAVWDAVGQQMLVWGGFGNNGVLADDSVWGLDFTQSPPNWKKRTTTGGPPNPRGQMGFSWDAATRQLLVFGGTDSPFSSGSFSDLWQLDVATMAWSPRTEPNGPPALAAVAMAWDAPNHRAVVGLGLDVDFLTASGLWTFDPAADGGGWSTLVATQAPTARNGPVFLGTTQPLQLWGGVNDSYSALPELYELDAVDAGEVWTRLAPDSLPPDRGFSLGTSSGVRRFIFGGYNYGFTNVDQYHDVWEVTADAGWVLLSSGDEVSDAGSVLSHPGLTLGSVVARE